MLNIVSLFCVLLLSCSQLKEYVKITDGNGTDVLYHRGCFPFATENLLDVQFGLLRNISVETYLGSAQSSVKIKFAILKNGISSGMLRPLSCNVPDVMGNALTCSGICENNRFELFRGRV